MTPPPEATEAQEFPAASPVVAEPTLLQRQREALRELFALAAESDELDRVHHAGREARQTWIDARHERIRRRIQARETAAATATSDHDAAVEALKIKQKEKREAFEREGAALVNQAIDRNRAEMKRIEQDEENAYTAAAKMLEDKQIEAARWLEQRHTDADTWLAQVAGLTQQRDERLTTFPKVLLRQSSDDIDNPDIQSSLTEPEARAQVEELIQRSVRAVHRLHNLTLPHALFGIEPYLWGGIGLAVCVALGYGAKLALPAWQVTTGVSLLYGLGAGVVLVVAGMFTAFIAARQQVNGTRRESALALTAADAAIRHYRVAVGSIQDRKLSDAQAAHDKRRREFQKTYERLRQEAQNTGDAAVARIRKTVEVRTNTLVSDQTKALASFERQSLARIEHRRKRLELRRKTADLLLQRDRDKLDGVFNRAQRAMLDRWTAERDRILAALDETVSLNQTTNRPWSDPSWSEWTPLPEPAAASRFGALRVTTDVLLPQRRGVFDLGLPANLTVPAVLAGPDRRNLLIQADAAGRSAALDALRAAMLRLLTTLPPGHVKFTMVDPVGLGQTFAGFMHLADYDETLVNTRIWSEPDQIDQRLNDLTDHLSYVIQKHLRNKFATIDEYNQQAGQLAEPYRFVVVADYPQRLSPGAVERLHAIAASGARCGVFVLVHQDAREESPAGVENDLAQHCTTIRQGAVNDSTDNRDAARRWSLDAPHAHDDQPATRPVAANEFVFRDDVYAHLPLTLDTPPGEQVASHIIHRVGEGAVDVGRVQLPFGMIAPTPQTMWSKSSATDLGVAIGKAGATRIQSIVFGHGVAQHALVAGKTGSGKSSLLHALVTNLALWYSPDELELYLIDFKKGVEFKPYVTHRLPHARAIAIESDRVFGLSILRKLDKQMDQRGELFRRAGVQNIAGYRAAHPDQPLPRTLLVVDEFHELFSQDDDIALSAASLLDRLVRQGRAFGMHALLGSQSLSGAAGLAMGTMSQMAIRIALMCGEADSQLILSDDNTAARLLSRPGEAIYNAQGGVPTANVFFQVAWLPEDEHRRRLEQVVEHDKQQRGDAEPRATVVFEGSTPADLSQNAPLRQALAAPVNGRQVARAWVGEPIAIDDPAAFELLRTSGANGLIVGQQAESALAVTAAVVLSLAAQHAASGPDAAKFVILNGSPEPEHASYLRELGELVPHDVTLYTARQAGEALTDLHAHLQTRLADTASEPQPIYFVVFALQRLRDLRRSEEDFSFNMDPDAGEKPPKLDKLFSELLHEGPPVGVHTFVWCDRAGNLDQSLERRDLRAFDQRLLFQMSANDSATLIDSADANQLGPFRALLCRDDRGTMQPIRPYGWPPVEWLRGFAQTLRKRETAEKQQPQMNADEEKLPRMDTDTHGSS